MNDTLYIVVPCYNEEAVLPETARRLGEKLARLTEAGKISEQSRVLFVNDGSRDGTWSIITELHQRDRRFSGVEAAVTAQGRTMHDLDVAQLMALWNREKHPEQREKKTREGKHQ